LFQAIPKLALRAQTVGIAFLSLRQDLWIKNVSMSDQKDLQLGKTPSRFDTVYGTTKKAWNVHCFSRIE